ncbi:MAG: tetratricopeptide repeat protein [Rhodoferax sp.]
MATGRYDTAQHHQKLQFTMTDKHAEKLRGALAQSDWPRLLSLCRHVLRKSPGHLLANRFHGFALHELGRMQEALDAYAHAHARHPNDGELQLNYANALISAGYPGRGAELLRGLTKANPEAHVVWLTLSRALYSIQGHQEGLACAEKALALARDDVMRANALIQRAIHRRELGQILEAIADCEAVLAMHPDDVTSHTNRMLFMLSDPRRDAMDIKRAADAYAAAVEPALKPRWVPHPWAQRTPWERLTVGFLSPDFRNHSVMYFVEGLLAQLDRRQFSLVAFDLNAKGDHITERVKRHVDRYVALANLSLQEQTARVTAEGIDILIDLAGHSGNNGLLIMAQRPAPVQISWLGYPATTGLTAIDYKFTDEVTDPPGADAQYSERLYRMQTLFCCYRPHIRNPLWRYQPAFLVQPTPALKNGYVTFGSCNNLGKLTDEVLTLWGELIRSNPTHRLLIEGKNFDDPEFAQDFSSRCQRLGIPAERLKLVALDYKNQYLTYHQIDIALDPFPLTGGTTSFDLLWMGVPLVSMRGRDFKGRLSTGMLTYLGKTDWLADDAAGYLRIANTLASDPARLNAQRLTQRQAVEAACLMNEDVFNAEFAKGLRQVWQRWLAERHAPGDAPAQARLLQQWQSECPPDWAGPAPKGIGIDTGLRASPDQAYEHLQKLLDLAKQQAPRVAEGGITHPTWRAVTEFCETILCALPHDPVALACLAEVEHAHGHTDFAVTYLRYAQEAMQG